MVVGITFRSRIYFHSSVANYKPEEDCRNRGNRNGLEREWHETKQSTSDLVLEVDGISWCTFDSAQKKDVSYLQFKKEACLLYHDLDTLCTESPLYLLCTLAICKVKTC